jgi:hypothetical protein
VARSNPYYYLNGWRIVDHLQLFSKTNIESFVWAKERGFSPVIITLRVTSMNRRHSEFLLVEYPYSFELYNEQSCIFWSFQNILHPGKMKIESRLTLLSWRISSISVCEPLALSKSSRSSFSSSSAADLSAWLLISLYSHAK